MKTLNLALGFISFVMAILLSTYSCITNLGGVTVENGHFGLAVITMLTIYSIVAGIIAIITKDDEGKYIYISAGFFIFGGILGAFLSRGHSDIFIWCIAYIACGITFAVISFIVNEDV